MTQLLLRCYMQTKCGNKSALIHWDSY